MSSAFGEQLQALAIQVGRLSIWLGLLVLIFVPLELAFAAHPRAILRRGTLTDLGYYFLSSIVPAALLSVPAAALAWSANRFVPAAWLQFAASLPIGVKILAGLVAGEVGYYWGHRWSHEIPLLWRFHAIHHSAEELDFLVNTRAHPFDMVFSRLCMLVPLYVLGLAGPAGAGETALPVILSLIGTIWGFFLHANLKWRLGPIEWLVSTPAFHHWHHTRNGPINKNYASTFPWLDRLFRTHHLPDHLPESYGITQPMPDGLLDQLLHPILPEPAPAATHQPTQA